jgi:predicted dehydrogenase
MQEVPHRVNCFGGSHSIAGVEDVAWMSLHFSRDRSAIIHSSWRDPRKVRETTITGSPRMIVYDDSAESEKLRIQDIRIEQPPPCGTFEVFRHGDTSCPNLKDEEPLRNQFAHFIECIREEQIPLTSGAQGLEVVRVLEASSESLRNHGADVCLSRTPQAMNSGGVKKSWPEPVACAGAFSG